MVERDNGFRRFYDGEGEGDNAPADNASAGDPPGDPLEGDAAPPAKETVATFESLPEELRNNKALAKFSGSKEWASEVAKAYVNAAGHLGRDPSKQIGRAHV